jgi:hypothetical protein
VKKAVKCPKCGGPPDFYEEFWSGAKMLFDAETFESFGNNDFGDPYCVYATCGNCGYSWRLRRVSQIIDILGAKEKMEERSEI